MIVYDLTFLDAAEGEDAALCSHCKAEKPDLVGLTLAKAPGIEMEDYGFCGIPCLVDFVQDRWALTTRATAVSPSPGRRSADAGRGGDSGATREPLPSGKSAVAPCRTTPDGGAT